MGYDLSVTSLKFQALFKSLALGLLVILGGTIGYVFIEEMGWFDALYMTTITVTTIGFKEVFPLSTSGRLFTMVLAFAGVGVILVIASEFARAMLETDLRRVLGIRRELKLMKRLKNHIVVCGHGRMGQAVVEVLDQRGLTFVVVDIDPDHCRNTRGSGETRRPRRRHR